MKAEDPNMPEQANWTAAPQPGLRSFIVYDELPPGCFSFEVVSDRAAPHVRDGDIAIIDPEDREPMHGELFLLAWSGGTREIVETRLVPGRYGTGPNGEMIETSRWFARWQMHLVSLSGDVDVRRWQNGPYDHQHMGALLDTVVGMQTGEDGQVIARTIGDELREVCEGGEVMLFDVNIARQTKEALAAIDLSAENARIAEIEIEIEELQQAKQKARERVQEINRSLSAGTTYAPAQIADSLLSDGDTIIAPAPESMKTERDALLAGAGELTRRIGEKEQEVRSIKEDARRRVRQVAQPLADGVMEVTRESLEALVECFAALKAISVATPLLAHETRTANEALRAAMQTPGRLVEPRMSVEVPAEIVDALSGLADKGPALRAGLITTAHR